MPFTISHDFNGYHGHRLKDVFGAFTLGHLFDIEYVHTPFSYLDFFGIGHECHTESKWLRSFRYKKIKRVNGPFWDGFDDFEMMQSHFQKELKSIDSDTLVIFGKACRVFPHQTIPWYKDGLIEKDIFSLVKDDVSTRFCKKHHLKSPKDKKDSDVIHVAIHINRGTDYDRIKYPDHFVSSSAVRYIFPLDYFENIMNQIENATDQLVHFTIYTESLHSEEIVKRFQSRKNTELRIGSNRRQKNNQLIYDIFMDFVKADILVSCNSSFSAMCAYFRKGKKTIYHPHRHLAHLPVTEYVQTDELGDFDVSLL